MNIILYTSSEYPMLLLSINDHQVLSIRGQSSKYLFLFLKYPCNVFLTVGGRENAVHTNCQNYSLFFSRIYIYIYYSRESCSSIYQLSG